MATKKTIVPAEIVEGFLEKSYAIDASVKQSMGITPSGDESQESYSDAEKEHLKSEVERLYQKQAKKLTAAFSGRNSKKGKKFYITAGGPGSGKTTLLRRKLAEGDIKGVYVDPDELLLEMTRFKSMLKADPQSDVMRVAAYTKWRWGSNYVSNAVMNRAASEGRNIALGITATSPAMPKMYENIKKAGYHITTVICHAPEDVRWQSAEKRFETERRYIPKQDFLDKGNKMFPDRVGEYFQYSDEVSLYWRDGLEKDAVLAVEAKDGKVTIHNQDALDAFLDELASHGKAVNWKKCVKSYETRFEKPAQIATPASKSAKQFRR